MGLLQGYLDFRLALLYRVHTFTGMYTAATMESPVTFSVLSQGGSEAGVCAINSPLDAALTKPHALPADVSTWHNATVAPRVPGTSCR